jgi:hypothetical protein
MKIPQEASRIREAPASQDRTNAVAGRANHRLAILSVLN